MPGIPKFLLVLPPIAAAGSIRSQFLTLPWLLFRAVDALDSVLNGLNLHAQVVYVGGVCGRWAVDHNSDTAIWFHLLTKGTGWAYSPTWRQPLALEEGDLLLFLPHAPTHYLSYSPEELIFDAEGAAKVELDEGTTGFVCGLFELDLPRAPFWRGLPAEILIRRREAGEALSRLLNLIVLEAKQPRFGSTALIEKLFDSAFVLVLRHCVESGAVADGMFAAMRDPRLAAVLNLIHTEPAQAWTLARLCAIAGVSKTVLIEKFAALVGCPPMEYLSQWRMQLAANYLRQDGATIEQTAERCGYDSVSAFSRTFKRHFGAAPGAYRRAG